jgi:hypothetical protein
MRVTKLGYSKNKKKGCVLKKPHDRSENFYYMYYYGRWTMDDFSVTILACRVTIPACRVTILACRIKLIGFRVVRLKEFSLQNPSLTTI